MKKVMLIVAAAIIAGSVLAQKDDVQHLCTDNTTMDATPPTAEESGQWFILSGGCTIENLTLYNTYVYDIERGANELYWCIFDGTNYTDEYHTVWNNTFDIDAGTYLPTCSAVMQMNGENPEITPEDGSTGFWSVVSGEGSGTFVNPAQYNTVVLDLGAGVNHFVWTVTRNGCEASDETEILRNMPPIIEIDFPDTILWNNYFEGCAPLNVQFLNLSAANPIDATDSIINNIWTFGEQGITPFWGASFAREPKYIFRNPTENSVIYPVKYEAQTVNGCIDSVTMNITVHNLPIVDFTVDKMYGYYPEDTIVFVTNNSPDGYYEYNWYWGDGTETLKTKNPFFHAFSQVGTYQIKLDNMTQYCMDSLVVPITIAAPLTIESEINDSEIKITELRASGIFRIYIPNSVHNANLEVISPEGRIVEKKKLSTGTQSIDLNSLKSGLYIFRIDKYSKKIILR